MSSKVCTKCGELKSLTEFGLRKESRDGHKSSCKKCHSEAFKQYRAKNPEKVANAIKNWEKNNADRKRELRRESRARNVGNETARYRRWAKANPERVAEIKMDWIKSDPERFKATQKRYAAANPEVLIAKQARRRAKQREADGHFTKQDVRYLLVSQEFKCKACGVDVTNDYHVDHVIALAAGGSNWPSNLQILCPSCNRSKGAKPFNDWMASRV